MIKLQRILIAVSLFGIISCNEELGSSFASIQTKKSHIMPKENVFFSTVQGKMIILCDARAAQFLDSTFRVQMGYGFNRLGVGNAFFVNEEGHVALFTAKHCAVGLEDVAATLEGDIAIIPLEGLKALKVNEEYMDSSRNSFYKIEKNFSQNDSVYIKGYQLAEDGYVYEVNISGLGKIVSAEDIKNRKDTKVTNEQYLEGNSIYLSIEKNIDLSGLSGAPAFNKDNKVVGVYAGRNMEISENDTTYYLRIALFN